MAAKKDTQLVNYELMIVLKPLLPDDVRKAIHKDLTELVKSEGGEITDVDAWGKRYLAYDVKGHNEGYYIVYNFRTTPSSIANLKRQLSLKTEVLKKIVVEVDHPEMIGKGIKKKQIDVEV